jgi:hypothetical protein
MDRLMLEEHIMKLYAVVDDLNDISYGLLEGGMDEEDAVNAVDGLAVMTKIKIEKLFQVFKQTFHLDEYDNTDAVV